MKDSEFKNTNFKKRIILIASLIFLDQFIKYLVIKKQDIFLIKTLSANLTFNPYISWGIPLHGIFLWIILLTSLLILLLIIYKTNFNLALSLIIAGAIGNIIDRIHFNYVVDFISFGNFPFLKNISFLKNFPVFNIADILITIGIILFIYQFLKKENKIL